MSATSRREAALSAVGTTVGQRWTLVDVIGTGGTATVYEAVHRNGSRVAVKVLHADFISHDNVRRRFLAEGYAANRVRHDGAVNVLDDGETADGGAYLVMELLKGETLAGRLLRNGPLPSNEVVGWGLAVLEVLASAHAHNVEHRDVKPSNIFITDRGQVKLLDFGIARILDSSARDDLATQQGVALGTPAFMAPEQAAGTPHEVGAPTDVWGVGATMFQLLTGRPVHGPSATPAVISAAPPVRAFAPNVPQEIAKVIDRALNLRSSDRWPTARSMIDALELARDTALKPIAVDADTLTEEGIVLPKAGLARPRILTLLVLGGLALTSGGAFFWIAGPRRASASNEVADVPVPSSRQVPAVLVTAAPAEPPEADPPHAISGVPRSKEPRPTAPTSHPRELRAPPIESGSLDSILDRRK